ncbi:nucleoside monophosphate kinase [Dactylosporangium sp. CA-152071]|uniref:nucleoside monophosphate kinase n=1 Tax=Dactylosporangium sp. CA-152071 TaxID=3239933 RepID=UPI003D9055C1
MRKVALVGGPGIDRSGPAQVLAEAYDLTFISAGDLFRGHVQHRTATGEQMDQYIRAGNLVPEELTATAIADGLAGVGGGWVLSGYPTTVGQAECLTRRGHQPDVVIELVLTEDEYGFVMRRWMELDPQQAERQQEIMLLHSLYQERAEPLRACYQARGMFQTTSGFGDYEDVAARLITIVSGG